MCLEPAESEFAFFAAPPCPSRLPQPWPQRVDATLGHLVNVTSWELEVEDVPTNVPQVYEWWSLQE